MTGKRREPAEDEIRVARMWRHELGLIRRQGWIGGVAGVDEAGRGPLAGPVVAGAVLLPKRAYLPGLDDSKRLSAKIREDLSLQIKRIAIGWSVAQVSVEQIDLRNILKASQEAMRQALWELPDSITPEAALLDGLPVPSLGLQHLAVVDGDALCPSIAAASILAKVHRDALMAGYDRVYPQYGFAKHKGYATPEHLAALRKHGPCELHRRSFHWHGISLFDLAERSEQPGSS